MSREGAVSDPQLWRIEQGFMPGCPVGTVVSVTRDGDLIRIAKPDVGVVATLNAKETKQATSNDGRDLLLRNKSAAIEVHLTPNDDAPVESPYEALVADGPPTIVRTYRGAQQADTTAVFQKEAAELVKRRYSPTSQSWAAADRTGALVGSLLGGLIMLWGILVVGGGTSIGIVLLVVGGSTALLAQAASPSGGSLAVTYERRDQSSSAPLAPAGSPATQAVESPFSNIEARLATLERLRAAGTITQDEFAARRNKILDEI
jgi:hypothetical protein